MIKRDELAGYLNEYLACEGIADYAPNGIQIEGRETINQLCSAVTASLEVIEQAIKMQADALLVHHGYFWRGENEVITGIKKLRIAKLLANDITLLAYHLPLDCHLDVGNNACLGELLDIQKVKSHKSGNTKNLLWTGILQNPLNAEELSLHIASKLARTPLLIEGSDKVITNIAWCTGGAEDFIEQAFQLGADAYISGEVSERTYHLAKELGIHYFAAGHHATERYGVQALGRHLSTKFSLRHCFIDSDNPV